MENANWVDFVKAGLVLVGIVLWFLPKKSRGGSPLKLPLWQTDWWDGVLYLLLGVVGMIIGLGFLLPCIVFFIHRERARAKYKTPLTIQPLSAGGVVRTSLYNFLFHWPVLFLISQGSAMLLPLLWPDAKPQENVQALIDGDWQMQARIAFLAIVFSPLTEELFFRGILYRILKSVLNMGPAMFITSFAFALAHLNLLAFIPLFALSFFLIFSYERTGHLGVPILYHAIFNLVMVISILYGSS